MDIKKFKVLRLIKCENKILDVDYISKNTEIELEEVKNIIKNLIEENLITEDFSVTDLGDKSLEPYEVKNAIIMAAGMSSRFAPLSYENPKSLLNVKGEILIERQINQLKEVGIDDITIVVGYMKEKMMYLKDKFNVKIIYNEDYYKYNNTSTLKLVLDELSNTYICSSDNYFVENQFEKYVYRAYYSCVFCEGETDEYCVEIDEDDRIINAVVGGKSKWIMLGHVYYDKKFSEKFKEILNAEYENQITREQLWEDLYIRYIDDLDMYIKKNNEDFIKEFDSLEDLRTFDTDYVEDSHSSIIKNICSILNCKDRDVINIQTIKGGITNLSFKFEVNGKKYVYRHPGAGTESFINRKSEYESMAVAKKLGLDNTHIYMNEEDGWKISYYIENCKSLDYRDEKNVELALEKLRILHNSGESTNYRFDIWNEIKKVSLGVTEKNRLEFSDFDYLTEVIYKLKDFLQRDNFKETLCHSDSYSPNFLIDEKGKMSLIDWEYSGMGDSASDVGTFVACADYSLEEAKGIIEKYFDRKPTDVEMKHFLGYIAVMSYYWFVWGLNQENNGNPVGEYIDIWHRYTKLYGEYSLNLYEEGV